LDYFKLTNIHNEIGDI
jgi:hypothetical protein